MIWITDYVDERRCLTQALAKNDFVNKFVAITKSISLRFA